MWSALGALALVCASSEPAALLESRPLHLPPFVLAHEQLADFDIYDVRSDMALPPPADEKSSRNVFRLRHHLGIGAGYDQGVLHGSLGLYVTVAELGRWNLGATSPAIGISRYRAFDRNRNPYTRADMSILISIASVHYRGGYLESLRKNWYINFEQVFDSRTNVSGSQVGISFSSP